jgi:hypothetical protein
MFASQDTWLPGHVLGVIGRPARRLRDRHLRDRRAMMPSVRALAIILVFVTACGSKQPSSGAASATGAATVFPAARWVPAAPTYVVSARSARDAQAGFQTTIDALAAVLGHDAAEAGPAFARMLGFDPLAPDALASLGVDAEGSVVVFSEDLNPTFVLHLSAPEQTSALFERHRERHRQPTQSVIVAGIELFTMAIASDIHLSWAIDRDWLWLHLAFDRPDGTGWFERSRHPAAARWVDGWTWANKLAGQAPALVGVVDSKSLLARLARLEPRAAACIDRFSAIQRVGGGFDATGAQLAGRLSLDLGARSSDLASTLVTLPPGWASASVNAALSAQWNIDLSSAARWLAPCAGEGSGGDLVAKLDRYGVRSARAFVHQLDPKKKAGTGAVMFDLAHPRYFRSLLDDIPGRSTFEKSRTFGVYKGTHISVPFVGKGDYVLDEHVAIAAMGDGVLARIGTGAQGGPADPLAIDLRPQALPAATWSYVFEQLDVPASIARGLLAWQDLHLGARLDGTNLVIAALGTRR